MNIKEIEQFFKDREYSLPIESIELMPGITIFDIDLFIESHIETLKAHPRNKTFMPAYERLLKLVEIIKKQS